MRNPGPDERFRRLQRAAQGGDSADKARFAQEILRSPPPNWICVYWGDLYDQIVPEVDRERFYEVTDAAHHDAMDQLTHEYFRNVNEYEENDPEEGLLEIMGEAAFFSLSDEIRFAMEPHPRELARGPLEELVEEVNVIAMNVPSYTLDEWVEELGDELPWPTPGTALKLHYPDPDDQFLCIEVLPAFALASFVLRHDPLDEADLDEVLAVGDTALTSQAWGQTLLRHVQREMESWDFHGQNLNTYQHYERMILDAIREDGA